MKGGDFKRLISVENLVLAWNRVSTAGNHSYKRFFRQVFYAYEFASAQNIRDLHARLTGASFEPVSPIRLFVPKGAGLNRSITLLHVEDQILLQALANILSESVRRRREVVEGNVVFSNLLNVKAESIFFLRSWRNCYRQFIDQITRAYAHGYKWVAYFDLAAFYDTISHELLLKTVYPKTKLGPGAETICGWLKHWITPRKTWPLQHGIPQGPQSSDFLAEIFLLPIDEAMFKKRCYVRYVDDIRLFGKTEFEVQAAVQELESLCRDRGLIPQGKKFAIVELKSLRDALGSLPSIASGSDQSGDSALTEAQAVKYFRSALCGKPLRVADKSRMRYVLFHGPPSARIRNWVLRLMQHHPEHTEAFAAYLRQFRRSERMVKACIELLRKTPSSFIKGELLQLLTAWVQKSEAKAILPIVKNLAKSKDSGVAAKWGAMSFLCRAEALGLGQLSKFVLTQRGLVQSLTIAQLPDETLFSPEAIKTFLQRKAVEPGLAFAMEAVRRRKTFNSLGVKKSAMPTQVWNLFVELDMTQGPYANVDPMAELLHRRYGIANTPIWKAFFLGEYIHAHRQLMQAEKLFDMGRSHWLSYQNSYNHAAFLVLQEHLNRLKLPGACATKDRHGKLINFGSMLSGTHPFPTNYPHIAAPFDTANRRRNKLDSSHPYDSKTGNRNSPLTKREQFALVAQLRLAFEELITFCSLHGIR